MGTNQSNAASLETHAARFSEGYRRSLQPLADLVRAGQFAEAVRMVGTLPEFLFDGLPVSVMEHIGHPNFL